MVGQSSSEKSLTLCLMRSKPCLIAIEGSSGGRSLLQLGAEAEQGVLRGHQLAPDLVEALELALDEPAVRRDRLVHPVGGLGNLEVDLAPETLAKTVAQGLDPGLEVALRLAALPGNEVEAADRESGREQNTGHVGG